MTRVKQEHLDARRKQILDAARRCFVRNGFHATSMQDIFAESGMSAGGIYRYFKSKDDLVEAIADGSLSFIAETCEELLAIPELPPLDDAVCQLLDRMLQLNREQFVMPIALQVWGEALRTPRLAGLVAAMVDRIQRLLVRLVERYQAVGLIDPQARPDYVARTLSLVLAGFVAQHAVLGDVDVPMVRSGLHALLVGDRRQSR
jgi:AcrR family transcriptional regulator